MKNGRCRLHGGLSTGPQTAEGLERIRKAVTKHGRYSQRPYDIFPDGRFVMIKLGAAPNDSSAPNLVIVQNWTEELRPPRGPAPST
jgi:hypothetical protein